MKTKLLIWMTVLIFLVSLVTAAPPNPEFYWGKVFVEGNLAQNGTNLTVKTALGELLANLTLPYSQTGTYYVSIPFDNLGTNMTDEGAEINESIIWYLDGVQVLYPANDRAETGKINDINISGFKNPNITSSIAYSASFYLGDLFTVNVSLDNTGEGSGKGDLDFDSQSRILPVAAGASNETSFNETTDSCGEVQRTLTVSALNFANTTLSTTTYNISYNVTGPDLEVSITASGSADEGDSVPIAVQVGNIGELNISGYNLTIKDGTNELITVSYNDSLEPGQTKNLTYYWTAVSGSHTINAEALTVTTQCLISNDDDSKVIIVSGSGGGGGGGHTTGSAVIELEREPQTFTIYNFPKELDNLIEEDKVKFESEGKWNLIKIVTVNGAVQADVFGTYAVFKDGDEKEFDLGKYTLYVRLTGRADGKADMRFDLVKKIVLDATLGIEDRFAAENNFSTGNVSFTLNVVVDKDTNVDEKLYRGQDVVWQNTRIFTESKTIIENMGVLAIGEYTLKVVLESGTEKKEIEKEFSVAEPQKPMPVKKTARDWLMLALIVLFAAALIMSIDVLMHKKEETDVDEPEEESPTLIERAKESFSGMKEKFKNKKAEVLPETKPELKSESTKDKVVPKATVASAKEAVDKKEPESFKTPDSSGAVYMNYDYLFDLKEFIEQYDKEKKLTNELKRMPYPVQKLGLELYGNPKEVSTNDVVKVNKLFTQKHDYISYGDLVIAGSVVSRQLKKDFKQVSKVKWDKDKIKVMCMVLKNPSDINNVIDEVRKGSVVIINANPLYGKFNEETKRAILKLKNTCDAIGGTVMMTNDRYLFASGSKVQLLK